MTNKTIVLTAGGTGGHLFPAFALCEELKRRGYTVDLITDERGEKFQSDFTGRYIYSVQSSTISARNVLSLLSVTRRIKEGIQQARSILEQAQPSVIMGFGGYPTLPPILAARKLKIKKAVHEANAVMGRANRLLAPVVDAIATSFEETKHASGLYKSKVRVTGNPVRDTIKTWRGRAYYPPALGHRIIITVFGGSQGARFFSDIVPEALKSLPEEWRSQIVISQQCRPEDLDRVEEFYNGTGITAEVAPFFKNLPDRLASSHLVICRSGAGTVSELTVIGRPSILVPLPHSIDNDQRLNAQRLAALGGCWHFEQSELTSEALSETLLELLSEPKKLSQAAEAAHSAGRPDAVERLADLVEELAEKHARQKK